ncbi:hypothetical protein OAO87_00995 [bacterium]|nr:hypothetical protein [bacterium]
MLYSSQIVVYTATYALLAVGFAIALLRAARCATHMPSRRARLLVRGRRGQRLSAVQRQRLQRRRGV